MYCGKCTPNIPHHYEHEGSGYDISAKLGSTSNKDGTVKVTLLYATPDAVDILLFTKNTRLKMSPNGLDEIRGWSQERKTAELEYMAKTVPSSWEFVDLIFCIEGVSRAFTHQLVRTRTASYAQQAMRIVDMTGFDYHVGPTITDGEVRDEYDGIMQSISQSYHRLIELGAKPEDARGVLPTDVLTNINMKLNLRSFADLVKKRSSSRVQSEYAQVLEQMISEARKAWPWIDQFIVSKERPAEMALGSYLQKMLDAEVAATGKSQNETEAWDAMKNLDIIRR